jgi:uncharacterized protein (TIGR00251 family)
MRISVLVKPGARETSVTKVGEDYLVNLKAPPVDGKANKALIEVVAKHFQVRRTAVTIKSGHSSRRKLLDIEIPQH